MITKMFTRFAIILIFFTSGLILANIYVVNNRAPGKTMKVRWTDNKGTWDALLESQEDNLLEILDLDPRHPISSIELSSPRGRLAKIKPSKKVSLRGYLDHLGTTVTIDDTPEGKRKTFMAIPIERTYRVTIQKGLSGQVLQWQRKNLRPITRVQVLPPAGTAATPAPAISLRPVVPTAKPPVQPTELQKKFTERGIGQPAAEEAEIAPSHLGEPLAPTVTPTVAPPLPPRPATKPPRKLTTPPGYFGPLTKEQAEQKTLEHEEVPPPPLPRPVPTAQPKPRPQAMHQEQPPFPQTKPTEKSRSKVQIGAHRTDEPGELSPKHPLGSQ